MTPFPPGIHLFQWAGCFPKQDTTVRSRSLRSLVFILTFLSYVAYHASRRPISVVKNVLNQNCSDLLPPMGANTTADPYWCDWKPFNQHNSNALLGLLDSAYLFSYALFMFFSGMLAERVDLRYFLALGMMLSGLFTCAFGFAFYWDLHSLPYFVFVQILGGAFQATGWPAVVTVMGNWFGKIKRGLIMGVWNSHTSIGNIAGTLMAAAFVDSQWGLSFIVPGCFIALIGLLNWFFLTPYPDQVGCDPPHIPGSSDIEPLCPTDQDDTTNESDTSHHVQQSNTKTSNEQDYGSINNNNIMDRDGVNGEILPSEGPQRFEQPSHASNLQNGGSVINQGGLTCAAHNTAASTNSISTSRQEAEDAAESQMATSSAAEEDVESSSSSRTTAQWSQSEQKTTAISFFKAMTIPGVVPFAMCLFFAKLVSYTFLYWLPRYLNSVGHHGATDSANLSTLFDLGGIIGGIAAGILNDYTGMPGLVCASLLMFAIPMMFVYESMVVAGGTTALLLLVLVGVLVNGPYALITTAVSADLGTSLRNNRRALATVTAIIDGTGSVGAAIGPLLAGAASSGGNWNYVFIILMVSDAVAMLSLYRVLKREIRVILNRQRQPFANESSVSRLAE